MKVAAFVSWILVVKSLAFAGAVDPIEFKYNDTVIGPNSVVKIEKGEDELKIICNDKARGAEVTYEVKYLDGSPPVNKGKWSQCDKQRIILDDLFTQSGIFVVDITFKSIDPPGQLSVHLVHIDPKTEFSVKKDNGKLMVFATPVLPPQLETKCAFKSPSGKTHPGMSMVPEESGEYAVSCNVTFRTISQPFTARWNEEVTTSTSSTPATNDATKQGQKEKTTTGSAELSVAAMAGIAIGCFLGFCVSAIIVFVVVRWYTRKKKRQEVQEHNNMAVRKMEEGKIAIVHQSPSPMLPERQVPDYKVNDGNKVPMMRDEESIGTSTKVLTKSELHGGPSTKKPKQ